MLALAVAAVLLILGRALAGVYSDYLWYDALGAGALWRAAHEAVLDAACRLRGLSPGYLHSVISTPCASPWSQLVFPRRVGNLEISEEVSGRYLMGAAVFACPPCSAFCSRCRTTIGRHSCSRARAGRSATPIRTSVPISASSCTGFRSRTRCGRGRCYA